MALRGERAWRNDDHASSGIGLILTILAIVLAPLVIGLVVALANGSARRTIIVAAIIAAVMVFIGVALADAITRLAGPLGSYRWRLYPPFDFQSLYLSELLLSVGLSVSFAAAILGLRETARLRLWGWFVTLLLTQVAAGIGTTLFYLTYATYMLDTPLLQTFYEGNSTITLPYYLFTSLLLIAVPLAMLLVAIIGIPPVETPNLIGPAQPAPMPPMPPAAPSSAPNQPYTP
jgi:hypothetical protein